MILFFETDESAVSVNAQYAAPSKRKSTHNSGGLLPSSIIGQKLLVIPMGLNVYINIIGTVTWSIITILSMESLKNKASSGYCSVNGRLFMKTDIVKVKSNGEGREKALDEASKFASYVGLDEKSALVMRLLSEETLGMVTAIAGDFFAEFWLESEDGVCSIHLDATTSMPLALSVQRCTKQVGVWVTTCFVPLMHT